jgi:N-acetylglucosamine kinase-like BadF-type ATPase
MRYVLGVDAGSSKTHALILDEKALALGFGTAGGGNHQASGLIAARAEIERAAKAALNQAALLPQAVELGCFCLAGADFPEDYATLQDMIEALHLVQKVLIKNDTLAGLRSGVTQPWGVVVNCGSGFNAAGRAPDGSEIVNPGLGPLSGDWHIGGGGSLAWEVIRLVMRAWDGRGQPTLLTQLVLDLFHSPSPEALLRALYRQEIDRTRLGELLPLLFEAAEARDEVAQSLLIQLGTEVGITANALIQRLGMEKQAVEVVLAGSVFKGKGHLLLETAARVVHTVAPRARVVRPPYEPVVGAALLALEAIGVTISSDQQAQLTQTLPGELRLA